MLIWIHSENVADKLPAPPEDLLTDGTDVSSLSYKWVPATLMLGGTPAIDQHPIQGCYWNRDKLRPDGPLGLYADLTFLITFTPLGLLFAGASSSWVFYHEGTYLKTTSNPATIAADSSGADHKWEGTGAGTSHTLGQETSHAAGTSGIHWGKRYCWSDSVICS